MHGLYSEAQKGDPACGNQNAHFDEDPDEFNAYMARHRPADAPCSVLVALMPDTRLPLRGLDGVWREVLLQPGEILVFQGNVKHYGPGYATDNYRIHAYLYPPDYGPAEPHIHTEDGEDDGP